MVTWLIYCLLSIKFSLLQITEDYWFFLNIVEYLSIKQNSNFKSETQKAWLHSPLDFPRCSHPQSVYLKKNQFSHPHISW